MSVHLSSVADHFYLWCDKCQRSFKNYNHLVTIATIYLGACTSNSYDWFILMQPETDCPVGDVWLKYIEPIDVITQCMYSVVAIMRGVT